MLFFGTRESAGSCWEAAVLDSTGAFGDLLTELQFFDVPTGGTLGTPRSVTISVRLWLRETSTAMVSDDLRSAPPDEDLMIQVRCSLSTAILGHSKVEPSSGLRAGFLVAVPQRLGIYSALRWPQGTSTAAVFTMTSPSVCRLKTL